MAVFLISYPVFWQYGTSFAEIDGRVTVFADGEVEVALENLAEELIPLTGPDLAMALIWVRATKADQLREAIDAAAIGARQYSREVARSVA